MKYGDTPKKVQDLGLVGICEDCNSKDITLDTDIDNEGQSISVYWCNKCESENVF